MGYGVEGAGAVGYGAEGAGAVGYGAGGAGGGGGTTGGAGGAGAGGAGAAGTAGTAAGSWPKPEPGPDAHSNPDLGVGNGVNSAAALVFCANSAVNNPILITQHMTRHTKHW